MRVQTESLRKVQDTTLWTAKVTAAVSVVGSAVYAVSEVEPSAAAQLLLLLGELLEKECGAQVTERRRAALLDKDGNTL